MKGADCILSHLYRIDKNFIKDAYEYVNIKNSEIEVMKYELLENLHKVSKIKYTNKKNYNKKIYRNIISTIDNYIRDVKQKVNSIRHAVSEKKISLTSELRNNIENGINLYKFLKKNKKQIIDELD